MSYATNIKCSRASLERAILGKLHEFASSCGQHISMSALIDVPCVGTLSEIKVRPRVTITLREAILVADATVGADSQFVQVDGEVD